MASDFDPTNLARFCILLLFWWCPPLCLFLLVSAAPAASGWSADCERTKPIRFGGRYQ